jgi:deoxycytidine triphosphate deaminase
MLLGRAQILEYVKDGLIEGFQENSLGGAGYDLSLGKLYRLKSGGYLGKSERRLPEVEEISDDTIILRPGDYILVETIESVKMPKELAARILNRSTLFRCGCALENALVDPGYTGTLTFGLKNHSNHDFKLERGARIAQIVFEKVSGETTNYSGRYQGGKVV